MIEPPALCPRAFHCKNTLTSFCTCPTLMQSLKARTLCMPSAPTLLGKASKCQDLHVKTNILTSSCTSNSCSNPALLQSFKVSNPVRDAMAHLTHVLPVLSVLVQHLCCCYHFRLRSRCILGCRIAQSAKCVRQQFLIPFEPCKAAVRSQVSALHYAVIPTYTVL